MINDYVRELEQFKLECEKSFDTFAEYAYNMADEIIMLLNTLDYIRTLTCNPRQYEPSTWTIFHLADDALKEVCSVK